MEYPDEPYEQPVVRNGEPLDLALATDLVKECLLDLFEGNRTGRRPLPVTGAHAEEAIQNAFVDLFEAATTQPETWMSTPTEVAADLLFTEWLALARRALNRTQRNFHQDRATGLERERIGSEARETSRLDVPDALAWIEDEGLYWDEVLLRFPVLADYNSPVMATLLLRWCTGWDAHKIAASLDGDVTAGDVFVRLVRMLRLHPDHWIALAGYCSGRFDTDERRKTGRRADLDLVISRNGWCDPFEAATREAGIALLIDWMTRTGKLPDPMERPEYEWPARAKRELVARRVATGFATHPRTHSRKRIWAPAESFTSIAGHLTFQRDVTADTTRKYFDRLRRDPNNAWITDLLPGPYG